VIPFENDNLEAYKLILRIEVALRESLRRSLETIHGTHWRRLLPGELLKKIREAQREENRPQFDYLRLGPLYYLTLGELVPILRQKIGSSVADRFGGHSFIEQLVNILGPRNALCHGRRIPSVGIKAIESLYHQMETALTPAGFMDVLSNPDIGMFPEDAVTSLADWLVDVKNMVNDLKHPVPVSKSYMVSTQQYWWGNRELAGFDCTLTERVVSLLDEYNALPSGIGSASERLRFCEERQMLLVIEAAINEARTIQ
jgi:hypothetical protein